MCVLSTNLLLAISQLELSAGIANKSSYFLATYCIFQINIVKALGTYTTPVLLWLLYRRGYMSAEGALALTKVGLSIGIIMGTSYCIRSYGRASNPKYREFLKKLESIKDGNGDRNAIVSAFSFGLLPIQL